MNDYLRTGSALMALVLSAGAFAAPPAAKTRSQTTAAAKAESAPVQPSSPAEAGSTPATGNSMSTGTAADLIGNAGDPATSSRGTITSNSSNMPSGVSAQNPKGPAIPTSPPK